MVTLLAEAEAGPGTGVLCRRHGISRNTVYHWCKKYGGRQPRMPDAHLSSQLRLSDRFTAEYLTSCCWREPAVGFVSGVHGAVDPRVLEDLHGSVTFRRLTAVRKSKAGTRDSRRGRMMVRALWVGGSGRASAAIRLGRRGPRSPFSRVFSFPRGGGDHTRCNPQICAIGVICGPGWRGA